ncbi:hypothetical protein [Mucilaginibacter sp.]|uniref:hypothetical protein n=1 Tax=Mucilaginibacter sp. TaxID=1882438 RepID=UPI0025FB0283|nr:hypothetical protein [Mucilaginibacter sp.]
MKNLLAVLLIVTLFVNCVSNGAADKTPAQIMRDTLKKPSYVPANATLLNLGSSVEPLFAWVELVGPLNKNGKIYSHILEVRYYFKSGINQTCYYENLEIRTNKKGVDFSDFKPLEFPFSGNIKISKGKDTLLLFEVLAPKEVEIKDNISFINVATIRNTESGRLLSTRDLQCNLSDDGDGNFSLMLREGIKIKYKMGQSHILSSKSISFINRENGNIYFLGKPDFLQLVDSKDVVKLNSD